MTFLQLFYEFFKIGLFSIGGGMATIPFLMDLAQQRDWFTSAQLTDMIAISESTPGPIGINMSTYSGYNAAGILGGLVATLSLVLPSLICICLVSKFMQKFRSSQLVDDIFYGIRPVSAAMIAGAMGQVLLAAMFQPDLFALGTAWYTAVNWGGMILFFAILIGAIFLKKLHPIVFIAVGAAAGIIFQL